MKEEQKWLFFIGELILIKLASLTFLNVEDECIEKIRTSRNGHFSSTNITSPNSSRVDTFENENLIF